MLSNEQQTKNKKDSKENENANKEKDNFQEKKFNVLGNCRSVGDFEKLEEIGEGTYGRVCKKI